MKAFLYLLLCSVLLLLPHNPQRAGNEVGGIEAGKHTDCHGKCKVFDGFDTVEECEYIDNRDSGNGGECSTDGTAHGLGDTEVHKVCNIHLARDARVFTDTVVDDDGVVDGVTDDGQHNRNKDVTNGNLEDNEGG